MMTKTPKLRYKAIACDGTDFYTGTVRWLPEGHQPGDPIPHPWIVTHPTFTEIGDEADSYLSVPTVATDCTGMRWPCRLLVVEGDGHKVPGSPLHKRAGVAWRVVAEVDSHLVFGPQGAHIEALIKRCWSLTDDEAHRLQNAWDAAWDAAWEAAWVAAWDAALDAAWVAALDAAWVAALDAALDAAWVAAWDAARDAARALVVRDLISQEQYDLLTAPWRTTIGSIHPDDEEM